MKYEQIADDFLTDFGEGSHCMHCDFRPQFDGYLLDFAKEISPKPRRVAVLSLAWQTFTQIAKWVSNHRSDFQSGDRCQIIVGWPECVRPTGRQILKGWIDIQKLTNVPVCFDENGFKSLGGDSKLVSGWDHGLKE
jgi:hypothetical protein